MSKLKLWKENWEEAQQFWNEEAKQAAKEFPLKELNSYPNMLGITPETAKNLKWKSLKWMILKDHQQKVLRGFLQHPFKYGWAFLKSLSKKDSYYRKGDLFFYGLDSLDDFHKLIQSSNTLLILGFSYCHKPFECPSGRFSSECMRDLESPICRQCFIGKATQAAASDVKTIPLFIPTVHYIGAKIFEIVHSHPNQKVIFMITACEMTLKMFGDWGNMVSIKGIGVRLGGRICNTMKAFELSENGIKPGLTIVMPETQKWMLDIIRSRILHHSKSCVNV